MTFLSIMITFLYYFFKPQRQYWSALVC